MTMGGGRRLVGLSRIGSTLPRGDFTRQGQGNELAARVRWHLLPLHPRLLGRTSHPRRYVAAAGHREGEVTAAHHTRLSIGGSRTTLRHYEQWGLGT
jgi:hypothetical protein